MAHDTSHNEHVHVTLVEGYKFAPWKYIYRHDRFAGSRETLIHVIFNEVLPRRLAVAAAPPELPFPEKDHAAHGTARVVIKNLGAPITLYPDSDRVEIGSANDNGERVLLGNGHIYNTTMFHGGEDAETSDSHLSMSWREETWTDNDLFSLDVHHFDLLPVLKYLTAGDLEASNGYLSADCQWVGEVNISLFVQHGKTPIYTWENVRAGNNVLRYRLRPPQLRALRSGQSVTHTKILELYAFGDNNRTQLLWSGPLRIDLPAFPEPENN